jgi:hypothetical protein
MKIVKTYYTKNSIYQVNDKNEVRRSEGKYPPPSSLSPSGSWHPLEDIELINSRGVPILFITLKGNQGVRTTEVLKEEG